MHLKNTVSAMPNIVLLHLEFSLIDQVKFYPMLFRQGFLFKLKPNGRQARQMARYAGCCRYVYNKGLSWAKEQYEKKTGQRPSYKNLSALLLEWKRDPQTQRLSDCYSQCLQQSMKDLSRAYSNFFSGRAAFPVFHRKHGSSDGFRYPQGFKLDESGKQVYLPGIGFVKYRRSRYIEGKAKNMTVMRKADGWYVSIQTEYEKEVPSHHGDEVGMDMGVVWFCTLSDGTQIAPCNALKKHLKKLAQKQRALSRKQKFSKNWKKERKSIANLHQRIGNIRQDYINKVALDLSKKHAVIYREDLKIKNMTGSAAGTPEAPGCKVAQKSGLNRAILDQGWGKFFQRLDWKCEQRGATVIKVAPQYTSRTCPNCGYESKENRPSQSKFKCVKCGYGGHADIVGAINIKVRGQRMSACGEPDEKDRVRVNRRMETLHGADQQQEPIEAIIGESR